MKQTVSFDTAKKLSMAGFPQPGYPVPNQSDVVGRIFYSPAGNKFLGCWQEEDSSINLIPYLHNKQVDGVTKVFFAPTALDIIFQMPEGTRLVKHGAGWACSGGLGIGASVNNCEDNSPHEAAAKAFLAWKAGHAKEVEP